jgi:peptidyl-prolyl cis-trans isomerase SurA
MNRIPKTLVVLFLLYVSSVPSSLLPAETCNRVVAVVNNEVITQYELEKKIREVTGFSADDLKTKDPQRFGETRRKVLDLMIDEKIAEEKVKELNIKVTQRQVDATIQRVYENQKMSREEFIGQIEKEGLTYEKFQEKVKRDLERRQLVEFEVKSKIIIRDEAVNDYYERNKKDFGSFGKVRLSGIFLIRKRTDDSGEMMEIQRKGEEILTRIRAGEDFGELAKVFSEGPAAASGGDLGVFRPDQLEPQLRQLIETLKEGSVSGLIPRQNGLQILKLVEKQEGIIRPLDEVREAIFNILYQEEVQSRYQSWIQGLRQSSYTRILTEAL